MTRRLYIETVGCQMNVLDSELIAADLLGKGYELVDNARAADTILFNTCSVRAHAEDKVYSALGRLKHVKEHRPGTVIGVLGCMAQKDRDKIFRRAPHVDVVVGPGQLDRLSDLLARARAGEGPWLEVSKDRTEGSRLTVLDSFHPYAPGRTTKMRPIPHQAMVRIVLGCDRFCSYCIVPSVRGPQRSRPAAEVEQEVRALVDDGCVEVTLLGQTVNGYEDRSAGEIVRLSDLLCRVDAIGGLARLKFVTNHPRYMTGDLIDAVRDLPRVSPYFHVPAQSGSNSVLERMNRGYTVESYREMLAEIREKTPGAAVTSDFIVGFCGETEEDFQRTVDLVRDARFKNSFIFKYSARPKTKAQEQYADDVPYEVKQRRNNELLAVQDAISLEDNLPLAGRRVEILVEGPSKAARKHRADGQLAQMVGRTECDRIVVFDGPRDLAGRLIEIEIERVDAFTLFGRFGTVHGDCPDFRGARRENGTVPLRPNGTGAPWT